MKFLREIAKRHGMIDVEEASVAAVIGFIVLAVVMSIGVVILYQVETATPQIANTSGWYTTQTQLATTAGSGYGLLAITLIVFAAVAILGTLFMLVRGSGND
ncbi:MAG: hypothetical protein ACP5NN_06745 [Methanolinea sp.]